MQPPRQAAKQHNAIDRRNFLAASAVTGLGSSVSASYNRLPASSGGSQTQRCVKVILQGGPSQIDLWDPKPNAPTEIRGAFKTISTNVAGIQTSECLPRISTIMDWFTIVRSVTGSIGSHDLTQAETGYAPEIDRRRIKKRKGQTSATMTTANTAQDFSHAQTLLQAGHTDIVLRFGNWDHHHQLCNAIKASADQLDQQLTQFVQSLAANGLLQQTTVLVWGEFGRSPRINEAGGRDHWPAVNSALIAGGPLARGNVYGATSNDGSHIVENPICMSSVIQQCCHSPAACLA